MICSKENAGRFNRISQVIIGGLAAVLGLAVVAIIVGQSITPSRSFHGALESIFPRPVQLPEWRTQFLPVAESAEMQRAVDELLNFDQAAFARYTLGSVEVSLYAAYWSPGKMSHRLIAAHTPDVCWVGAGWERVEARQTQLWESGMRVGVGSPAPVVDAALAAPVERLTVAGAPWEFRKFTLPGRIEYVVFLHLVGGQAINYGVHGAPPWYSFLVDLFARGLRQREEQFFVRISGNRPLSELLATEPVRLFLLQFEQEALTGGQRPNNG
jgi:hypothetical protein